MGIDNPVHLIFIAAVALIVLGPKRLPDLARSLGQGMREFRDSMSEAAKDDGSVTGTLVPDQAQLVAAPQPAVATPVDAVVVDPAVPQPVAAPAQPAVAVQQAPVQQAPVQQAPHAGRAGPGSAAPAQEAATETVAQPAPPPAS
jgi:sec-independent protein translocase protein TatA